MNTCAWCGATRGLHRTRPIDDPGYDIDPIWLCTDREPCRRRAETKTIHQLSTGEQP
jgi:hypothetical protein